MRRVTYLISQAMPDTLSSVTECNNSILLEIKPATLTESPHRTSGEMAETEQTAKKKKQPSNNFQAFQVLWLASHWYMWHALSLPKELDQGNQLLKKIHTFKMSKDV